VFEVAELGHTVKKTDYQDKVTILRTRLLIAQQKLQTCDFSVVIMISGVDGGGKGEIINLLNEWMDTRYMRTVAFSEPSDEERERPKFWRYWRTLPPKGAIAIHVGSWYSAPLAQTDALGKKEGRLLLELMHIRQFEQELVDDGALIVKCWLHLKKDKQKKRLKALQKNPETKWRVTEKDIKHLDLYDDFIAVAEKVLSETSTAGSPWLIVDGTDIHYSSLTVGQHILNRIEQHIERREMQKTVNSANKDAAIHAVNYVSQQNLLDSLDLSLQLDKKTYKQELAKYQSKINKLTRQARELKRSSLLVFEGWDAGGKGGAIRRLTHAMDARNYQVIPVAAPTDEEKAHHYLWRFWRHIPRAGQVTVYDRSWYGRVLVERVEGLARCGEWQRAYLEIVDFEEALVSHGIVLLKFWMHIDKDEQLKRFKEREKISYKKYKITEEDYRNREKWADYQKAVNEMIARTSTRAAPWILVEGNSKYYARVKVLKAYCQSMEKMLDEYLATKRD